MKSHASHTPKSDNANDGAMAPLAAAMDALDENELVSTAGVDPERAARGVLARCHELRADKELFKRFTALAAVEHFRPQCVTDAEAAAEACLALGPRSRTEAVASSDAKLDAALVAEATTRKTRMQRILSHYFEDDAAHGPELADIRVGSGYADLSSDLKRLAALYADPKVLAVIRHDPKFYDANDAAQALSLASRIDRELAATASSSVTVARLRRAFTLLARAYDQLRRGLTFLQWGDATALAPFPPLATLGRKPASASAGQGDTGTPPQGTGASSGQQPPAGSGTSAGATTGAAGAAGAAASTPGQGTAGA